MLSYANDEARNKKETYVNRYVIKNNIAERKKNRT